MPKFAKLFDLDDDMQLLVFVERDDDNEDYDRLHQMCRIGGDIDTADLSLAGPTEAIAKVFAGYDAEGARRVFEEHIKPIVERFTPSEEIEDMPVDDRTVAQQATDLLKSGD